MKRFFVFLASVAVVASGTLRAATFVVESTSDAGPGSLRQAIIDANVDALADTIVFNIPSPGVQVIAPASGGLPSISSPVTIDGYTQPGAKANTLPVGSDATLLIALDGVSAGFGADGFRITAGNCTIRGIVFYRFSDAGVDLSTNGGNTVAGNFFGTNSMGTSRVGGNRGIRITGGSSGNTIGGNVPAARNVISGLNIAGVEISAAGNIVIGNYIGPDASGTAAIGGNQLGIEIDVAPNNRIGGAGVGEGNVISGQTSDLGILISGNSGGPTGTIVQGNLIGTDATGRKALPNFTGLAISPGSNSLIGGTSAAERNIISGNNGGGVTITPGIGNIVRGNFIGLDVDGSPLPNGEYGIEIGSSGNTVGGLEPGAGNAIAYNGGDGVIIFGNNATGNAVLSNSIYANGRTNLDLGIDLGASGASSNDAGDPDLGSNGLQNYPILASAIGDGAHTTIAGKLNSTPNATFRLEFFSHNVRYASDLGQGENFIGALDDVTTDADGNASFSAPFPQKTDGQWVTATATDFGGSTSEFSPSVALTSLLVVNSTAITVRNGLPFRFQVVSAGGSPATRLNANGLPPGVVADPGSGIISGTPTADGSYEVQLELSDSAGVATATLQFAVVSDPNFPVIVSPSETTLTRGQAFSYKIDAPTENSSADPVIFSLQGVLPPGLSFDANTGIVSGTLALRKAATGGGSDANPLSGGVITNVQLFAKNASGTATKPLVFFLAPVGTVNISTRISVGGGDDVLIGGFIITGNAPKKVIIRAVGPSLGARGIAGALQDTTLQIFDGDGVLLGSNDDWQSDQEQEVLETGIAPPDIRESAAVATLAPGNYTAIVAGKDGSAGVGLVEVYDLGTASLDSSSSAQLAQISTRGRVLAGEEVMIGGFIVSGASANVLLRGLGPSLSDSGVANPLADPTLTLVDSNGQILAMNDDWKETHRADIEATLVPPNRDAESAILRPLMPGAYTAVLRGKDDTVGVALVEVYNLP